MLELVAEDDSRVGSPVGEIVDSLEAAMSAMARSLAVADIPQVCRMANKLMSFAAVGRLGSTAHRGHLLEPDEELVDLSYFDCSFLILINHY